MREMATAHPWRLFEQYVTGLLSTHCQQQPHRVRLCQPVQHTHPPSQGVVTGVPFTPDPVAVGGLQVNSTHLTLHPGRRDTEKDGLKHLCCHLLVTMSTNVITYL